jgi:Cof subfamily protein (haloacid dehalogenase superfamily)
MSIRLIALDLDGTLLNDRREISRPNREALLEAALQGIRILITTGRRFDSARVLLTELGHPVTVAASNGALVGTVNGEILRRDYLPQSVAAGVLGAAFSHIPYAVVIHETAGRGQVVMQRDASPLGPLGWYLANSPECLLQVPNLAESLTVDPVHVMFGGPPEVLDPIESLLVTSRLASEIHLTWTRYEARNICILDILKRDCSKGQALKWFAQREGVEPSEVMAIGDNFNDVEMLEFAGTPVLMANAPAPLARKGWHKTRSNLDDGVAAAVRLRALA